MRRNVGRCSWVSLLLPIVLLCSTHAIPAEEKQTPSASTLIQQAWQAQSWWHEGRDVEFLLRDVWRHTPLNIALQKEEFLQMTPGADMEKFVERFAPVRNNSSYFVRKDGHWKEVLERTTSTYVKIFNGSGLHSLSSSTPWNKHGPLPLTRTWVLNRPHGPVEASWPIITLGGSVLFKRPDYRPAAEFYRLVGQEAIGDVSCWKLERPPFVRPWLGPSSVWIGVDDGLIRKQAGYSLHRDKASQWHEKLVDWCMEHGVVPPGRGTITRDLWKELPDPARWELVDAYASLTVPFSEREYGEWKEVGAANWVPYIVKIRLFRREPGPDLGKLLFEHTVHVEDFRVEPAIDDSAFRADLRKGDEIQDYARSRVNLRGEPVDPPMIYVLDPDRSPKEMDGFWAEYARKVKEREAFQERELARVGKPIPEFSVTWIQGAPVTLEGLKGKVVLLDFWATYCGPCILALPKLQRLADQMKHEEDFILIGIHADSTSTEEILAVLKQEGASYPVARDAGRTFEQLGIDALPALLLLDRKGIVQAINAEAMDIVLIQSLLSER